MEPAPSQSKATLDTSLSPLSPPIPEAWHWIKDILDEAHLPHLGLPAQWDKTQEKNTLLAFDPKGNKTIHIKSGEEKKTVKSPVGFIEATRGQHALPGSQSPAAVRYTQYMEPRFHKSIVQGARGEFLAPCLTHGDYVKVEALQSEHLQAKETIRKRQQTLVNQLNDDPKLAQFIMTLNGMDKFFVKVKEQYYGTLFFYQLYFNDIDNIWLICEACNLHKSNHNTLEWLKEQWLYGDDFLDYLGKVKDKGILTKTQDNKGLAQVTIAWFWDRHAHYISIAKKLMKNVVTPVQILNQRVDHIIGLAKKGGGGSEKRVQRHMASLDFRLALLTAVAELKGMDMPKADSESSHSSSDEGAYLTIEDAEGKMVKPKLQEYEAGTERFMKKFPVAAKELLAVSVKPEIEQQKKSAKESGVHPETEIKRFKPN